MNDCAGKNLRRSASKSFKFWTSKRCDGARGAPGDIAQPTKRGQEQDRTRSWRSLQQSTNAIVMHLNRRRSGSMQSWLNTASRSLLKFAHVHACMHTCLCTCKINIALCFCHEPPCGIPSNSAPAPAQCHAVPCGCVATALCASKPVSCALRCSWSSACASPFATPRCLASPPEPNSLALGKRGGGARLPVLQRCLALAAAAIARPACCLLQRPPRAPPLRPLAPALRPPRCPVPSLWVATPRGGRRCPAAARQGRKCLELMLC
jgi:hypothetical protein